MCMRKSSLYASLPLPSIPTELPPSPCAEKVSAFSDCHIYEYDSSEFQMTVTVLQHLNDTSCLLSPRSGKVPAKPGIGVSLSRPGTSNLPENR